MIATSAVKPGAVIRHKAKRLIYIVQAVGKLRDETTGEWKDAVRYSPNDAPAWTEYYRTVADVCANFELVI